MKEPTNPASRRVYDRIANAPVMDATEAELSSIAEHEIRVLEVVKTRKRKTTGEKVINSSKTTLVKPEHEEVKVVELAKQVEVEEPALAENPESTRLDMDSAKRLQEAFKNFGKSKGVIYDDEE